MLFFVWLASENLQSRRRSSCLVSGLGFLPCIFLEVLSLSDQDDSWEAGHYLPRMHNSVNPWGNPSKDFWCYDVKFSAFGLFTTHSVMEKLLDFFHTFPREWRGYHLMICSLPVMPSSGLCDSYLVLLGCFSKGSWYFRIYKFKTKNKHSSINMDVCNSLKFGSKVHRTFFLHHSISLSPCFPFHQNGKTHFFFFERALCYIDLWIELSPPKIHKLKVYLQYGWMRWCLEMSLWEVTVFRWGHNCGAFMVGLVSL